MQNEFGTQEPLSNGEVVRIRKGSECTSSSEDEIDIESSSEETNVSISELPSELPSEQTTLVTSEDPPPEPVYSVLPVPKSEVDSLQWSSSPDPDIKETVLPAVIPSPRKRSPKDGDSNNKSTFVQDVLHISAPQGECSINRNAITEEEKEINREFFLGHTQKTPDRYIKIRNYILDCWERSKPQYVNKTSVRSGLKSCGDVNSIGRVHTYLEMTGAINFGCEQVHHNRKALLMTSTSPLNKKSSLLHNHREDAKRPRKRKHPVELSSDEPEGYTFHHDENGEVTEITTSHGTRSINQVKQSRGPNKATTLKLIPTAHFSPENPAPFTVELCVTTMLVVDVHAHLQETEVMGLLGGHYLPEERRLIILAAEPCDSLSSGIECEMDPVSQNQAAESLQQQQGLQVVGWYHSHPTFFPSPSVRDIGTQASFQKWFSDAPFVGLIVSPYVAVDTEAVSRWKCIVLGDQTMTVGPVTIQRPYQFDFIVDGASLSETEVITKVALLNEKLSNLRSSVSMWYAYPPIPGFTYLDKLLKSAEKTMEEGDVNVETSHSLLFQIRQILGPSLDDETVGTP